MYYSNQVLAAPQFGPQAFLPNVVVKQDGTSVVYYQDLSSFTVAHGVSGVTAAIYGDVGQFNLESFSDGFGGTVYGNVGDVAAFDVWNANTTVTGNVGGVSLEYVNGFQFSAWGSTNVANFNGFWDSAAYFGQLEEGHADWAISSSIVIEMLEEEFSVYGATDLYLMVYYGQGTGIDIDASTGVDFYGVHMGGAHVGIYGSEGTRVEVEYGDVVYHDQGTNSTIIDGAGNSTLFLEGSGQVLANGGEGDDTFVIEHKGTAILQGGTGGDSFVFERSVNADVVILDYNQAEGDSGSIVLAGGQVQLDLSTAMDVFGVENDDGSTTVEVGNGSITTYTQTDDFLYY